MFPTLTSLAVAQQTYLAQIGTGGLSDWIQDNVIGLLVLVGAAVALWAGSIGRVSKVITVVGGIVLALFLVGLAVGDNWESISEFLAGLFGAA